MKLEETVRLLSAAAAIAAMLSVTPDMHAAEPATQPVVKVIADFESGTWDGWTVDGTGFGPAPFKASTLERDMKRAFTGWHGDYMLGNVKDGKHDSRHVGIPHTVARSPLFTIEQPWLVFMLGGELNPNVRVYLTVDGQEVRSAYPNNIYDLVERGWDVSDLKGKQAQFVVQATADVSSLIRFDYLTQRDYPPKDFSRMQLRPRWESPLVRAGEYRLALNLGPQAAFSHSIVRGHDGRWHLFATVADYAAARWDAKKRVSLLHASSDSLASTAWTNHGVVFTADPEAGESALTDSNVVYHDGVYYLYYVGSGTYWGGWKSDGGTNTQGPYSLHVATSRDGQTWQRHPGNPVFSDAPFLAAPYITRADGKWVMYYGSAEPAHIDGDHCVVTRTSDDLLHWSDRSVAMRMNLSEPFPEHPYLTGTIVVNRGPYWYLFSGNIGNENQSRFYYRKLFVSGDPFRWFFDGQEAAGIYLDGNGKMLRDPTDGTWYVSTAGTYAGGVWVAPLRWYDRQDAEPSMTHPAFTPVSQR